MQPAGRRGSPSTVRWPPLAAIALAAPLATGCPRAATPAPPLAPPRLLEPPSAAATSPAEVDRAAATRLLDLAVAAKGGRDRLLALRTLHTTGAVRLRRADREVTGRFERWVAAPDRQRLDVTLDGRTIAVIVAGDDVGERDGERAGAVDGEAADQLVAALWRDRDLVLQHALAADVRVGDASTETLDGVRCDAFTIRRAGQPRVRVLLDATTHAIVRLVPLGDDARGHEDAADYRAVDGVQLAHRITAVGPGPTLEFTVETAEVDAAIAPELFALP